LRRRGGRLACGCVEASLNWPCGIGALFLAILALVRGLLRWLGTLIYSGGASIWGST
jgi:hypothetical protein